MNNCFKIGKLIFCAYLLNKDTLAFTNNMIDYECILLNEDKQCVDIKINNRHYLLKLDADDYNRALEIKKIEQKKSKIFFEELKLGKAKIHIFCLSNDEYLIRSFEAWDRGYCPYFDKLLRYMVETKLNSLYKNNDNEEDFQVFLNKRFSFGFNPAKYKYIATGIDKYIEIDFGDFINIIK